MLKDTDPHWPGAAARRPKSAGYVGQNNSVVYVSDAQDLARDAGLWPGMEMMDEMSVSLAGEGR